METKNPDDLPQIEGKDIDGDSIEILWKLFKHFKEWSYGTKRPTVNYQNQLNCCIDG